MANSRSAGPLAVVAALVTLAAPASPAQTAPAPYAAMAPVAQYLMPDRAAEIALARSAAPDSISSRATVLVLGRRGYEKAVAGSNGFVCVVERAWMGPPDNWQFWSPRIRGPVCFNPPAARSILPITLERTELILSGASKQQMVDGLRAARSRGRLPRLEAGAMSYMMSKGGFLDDSAGPWRPHLMFYAPAADSASWGADVAGSPVMLNPQFLGTPEQVAVFMVALRTWSDGSPAKP